MPRHLRLFFFAFGAWIGVRGLALAVEHSSVGQVVFASPASVQVYLGLQAVLTSVAFILGVWSVVRGPNSGRLMVAVPLILLAVYGAMLIAGAGVRAT